jgi:hypothetical protein
MQDSMECSADDGRLNVSHNLFFPSFLYVCMYGLMYVWPASSAECGRDDVVMLVCIVITVCMVSQEVKPNFCYNFGINP